MTPPHPTDPRVLSGLALLLDGQWFEAHEALELPWRDEPPGPRRHHLQGLIQLAVSLEHLRRHNPRGAWGQWHKARGHLAGLSPTFDGVHSGAWVADLDRFYAAIDLDERSRRQVAREPAADLPALPPWRTWPLPVLEPSLGEAVAAAPREVPH